jgi:tripartite-type tricarboxylate transporter receptor subunit TctC
MLKKRKIHVASLLSVLMISIFILLTGFQKEAQSQEKYPTKPVEIIVPFGPGGTVDLVARIFAMHLKTQWGVPVNVINKGGGNTIPATLEVYRSKPDGYTVLAESVASCSMQEAVTPNLPFKVVDRTFIAIGTQVPMVFIVPYKSSFNTMKDLEQGVKVDPQNFAWASLGGSSAADFVMRHFFKVIGVDFKKTRAVIGTSGSEITMLVAGEHAKVTANGVVPCYPAMSGKTVKGLAVTSNSRFPLIPDIPTTLEAGYPSLTQANWVGISGPPKMPSSITSIWDKAFQQMVKDREFISKLEKIGGVAFYHNGQGAQKYVMEESKVVNELWGIK